MEYFSSDGAAILRSGARSRRTEAGQILDDPRGRGQTTGSPYGPQARCGNTVLQRGARQRQPHASDEHAFLSGAVFGGGGGDGGRTPAGHCHCRIPLFHGQARGSSKRGRGLSHQSRHGRTAVCLPDLRLFQPFHRRKPTCAVCPRRTEYGTRRCRGAVARISGSGGFCGSGRRGSAPPAAARGSAGCAGLSAAAAARPAGVCPICLCALPVSAGGLGRQRRHGGGRAVHGRRALPPSPPFICTLWR